MCAAADGVHGGWLCSEQGKHYAGVQIIVYRLTCWGIARPVGNEVFYLCKAEHAHEPCTDDSARPCSMQTGRCQEAS